MTTPSIPARGGTSPFPLRVSASRRCLEAQDGRPFLLHGDTAWSLIVGGSLADAERYLDDRASRGFSATIVNLIERCFAPDPPRTADGIEPFLAPGDFRAPNDAYFDRAVEVVRAAEARGIVVMLAPCYLGYRTPGGYPGYEGREEGWYHEVLAAGVDALGAYGRYVGERLAGLRNVIWVLGGDRCPTDALPHTLAMRDGLLVADPTKLLTAHVHPGCKALDWFPDLDVNQTYTYGIVHQRVLEDVGRRPVRPDILFESTYEGEHDSTPLQIRRQAWWAMLSGACGQFFGSNPMWGSFPGWLDALDTRGARDMTTLRAFLDGIPWWTLVPDSEHRFVVEGLGEANGLDRVTAAVAVDGALGVAYLPVARRIVVALGAMADARLALGWFDPRTGGRHPIGHAAAAGRWAVEPPGPGDWVFTAEVAGR